MNPWIDELTPESLASVAAHWPGALDLADETLTLLLAAARTQCEAYSTVERAAAHPETHRLAQILQARALSRAGVIGTEDTSGGFGETVTVFPMDWNVKRLLNPERRIGGLA